MGNATVGVTLVVPNPVLIAQMRPCRHADCERWFAPARRHPHQAYCSRACKAADLSARQVEAGNCGRCWRANPDAGTHRHCPACRRRVAGAMKRLRANRKADSRCVECGKPVKAGQRCAAHKVRKNRAARQYQIRLAMGGAKPIRRTVTWPD